jgi:DNA-binding MarR family transcriptional regulator
MNPDPENTQAASKNPTAGLFSSSTFFFSAIANKQTHIASTRFRKEYGIGIIEWRCLAMLKAAGQVSASQICAAGGMNKSLVSRAISRLQQLEHIKAVPGSQKPLLLEMTQSGNSLFRKMFQLALEIEQNSMDGLDEQERKLFLALLKKVYSNVEGLLTQ